MTATSASVIAFFPRQAHDANLFQPLVAPLLAFAGLGTILYLAATNMDSVIGGSRTAGNVALAIAVAIIATGVVLALRYRSVRPDVYERIGSQDI